MSQFWAKIKAKIKAYFKPKEVRHINLSPELIEASKIVGLVSNENAQLKGEIGKLKSQLGATREASKDKDDEENVITHLNTRKKQLESRVEGKFVSLKTVFNFLKNPNRKVFLTDFEGSTKLSEFGDFGISPDGYFCIFDKDKVLWAKSHDLKQMFHSVKGLEGDIRSGKIPLNVDNKGNYVPCDLMYYDAPEIVEDGEGRIKFTSTHKKPVLELLKNYGNTISKFRVQLEQSEMLNVGLQKKNDKLESEFKIAQSIAETSKTECSLSTKRMLDMNNAFAQLEKELNALRTANTINEDDTEKLESSLKKMRKIAQREETKTSDEKARDEFRDSLGLVGAIQPDIPIHHSKETKTGEN